MCDLNTYVTQTDHLDGDMKGTFKQGRSSPQGEINKGFYDTSLTSASSRRDGFIIHSFIHFFHTFIAPRSDSKVNPISQLLSR